jgi:hypothetical protein
MVEQALRPSRGGFQRPFGCGWFIREFLAGRGPNGSPKVEPEEGAPQTDIFSAYKEAVIRARAEYIVAKEEEKRIIRGEKPLSAAQADALTEALIAKMPIRSRGMSYHSFNNYFGIFKRLGWVEATGSTEPSTFQEHYPDGQPRIFYRITDTGMEATEEMLNDPVKYLYGYSQSERSHKKEKAGRLS